MIIASERAVSPRGQLRLIAGRYRGRKLPIPEAPGLRPTPDRVRETLFNWLAPVIEGARCLDLFAGSGALGFEAVSRGAREVVMVERVPTVARVLLANARALGAREVRVEHTDALRWLGRAGHPFDVVFLDPPFAEGLLGPACALLESNGWLARGAQVYLETPADAAPPSLPSGWELTRERRAGHVRYALAVVQGGDGDLP